MKEYKKFDLAAAKSGAPVITRDGRKARIVCFDMKEPYFPLVTLIDNGKYEYLVLMDEKGTAGGVTEGCYDLFMAPVKRTVWVNVYKGDRITITGESCYPTPEEAKEGADLEEDYLGAYPIEIED